MYENLAIMAAFIFLYSVASGGLERMSINGAIMFADFRRHSGYIVHYAPEVAAKTTNKNFAHPDALISITSLNVR